MIIGGAAGWRSFLLAIFLMGSVANSLGQTTKEERQRAEGRWLSLNSDAALLYEGGRYSEGLRVAQRALSMAEDAFGPMHAFTGHSLNKVAGFYVSMAEFDKALPLYQRALNAPENSSTSDSLYGLAMLYAETGEFDRALPFAQRVLSIEELALGADSPEISAFVQLVGSLYRRMEKPKEALPYLERALKMAEISARQDAIQLAACLTDLAMLYESTGAYDKALLLYERALSAVTTARGTPHPRTAVGLRNLGGLFLSMGAYASAQQPLEKALAVAGEVFGSDSPMLIPYLNDRAGLLYRSSEYDRALSLYDRALAIAEKAEGADSASVARIKINVGNVYREQGKSDLALDSLRQSLDISARALGLQHPQTAYAMGALGGVYRELGKYEQARSLYDQALSIALTRLAEGRNPELLSTVAAKMCFLLQEQSPDALNEAIFYCKLGVNARQLQRRGTQRFDVELREKFTRSVESEYKLLAQLLSRAGRLVEAEQVLIALKEFELSEYLRSDVSPAGAAIFLAPEELRLKDDIDALARSLMAVYVEESQLPLPRPAMLNGEARRLYDRRVGFQKQLQGKLSEVAARLQKPNASDLASFQISTNGFQRLTHTLSNHLQGESAAIVSYVIQERVTTVVLFTPSGPLSWQLEVGSLELNPLIDEMRNAMVTNSPYVESAQKLYRYLIRPLDEHLVTMGQTPGTWMLYLTGRLRYLPFAALVDDQGKHLIEKQRLVIYTAAAGDQLQKASADHWAVAAYGSTVGRASDRLGPLPSVGKELRAIVRDADSPGGVLPGQAWLNAKFSRSAWLGMLSSPAGSRANVLHVATHFVSRPGSWEQSYLLLGDSSEFRVSEFRDDAGMNLDDIDLMTLSACSTEFGDEAEDSQFEGLGALLQKKGARSVMGTLWAAQDEGTSRLMQEFYRARGEKRQMSKAAALQVAQLQLLRGEIKAEDPKVDFRHPRYWALLVLMGNWF